MILSCINGSYYNVILFQKKKKKKNQDNQSSCNFHFHTVHVYIYIDRLIHIITQ